MKRFIICLLTGSLLCAGLAGCGASTGAPEQSAPQAAGAGDTVIVLDDGGITVDGAAISTDEAEAVYAAHDIVFYLEGQDFTYGEGSEADAHSRPRPTPIPLSTSPSRAPMFSAAGFLPDRLPWI